MQHAFSAAGLRPPAYRLQVLACVAMLIALLLDDPAFGGRTAVTTGEMLSSAHEKRWLYVSTDGGPWTPTYTGTGWAPAAQGKLMNLRAANALFDDEGRSNDDPVGNTNRFIASLDAYRARGILGFTTSLQGGNPGYSAGVVSAFRSDGSLKDAWMQRAAQVIEAADARRMVVILTYFYQRQDQVLADNAALRRGVVNATDWLIAHDYRNVVIEIANEYNSSLHDRSIITSNSRTGGIGELIELAKSRFSGKGWRLPVTASSRDVKFSGALRETADIAHIHGNLTGPSSDASGVRTLVADGTVHGPVVMNEDSNGDTVTGTNLANEKSTATKVFDAGGSWGLMWRPYMQFYPFRWALGSSTDISGGSQANYLTAVLEHIAGLTLASAGGGSPPPVPPPTPSPEPTPPSDLPADAKWTHSPTAPRVGEVVRLDGTASTGNPPLSCLWEFTNASGTTIYQTRVGCAIDFTFQGAGTKDIRLRVTDADGDTDSDLHSFVVSAA